MDHQGARIWIVEDQKSYRLTLKRLIDRTIGWECDAEFAEAESLMEQLAFGEDPDLILLDLGLPGVNGDAVLPQIVESSPRTKVIILSAQSAREVVFRAIRLGAAGYLLKGSSEAEIRQRIREVLKGGAALSPEVGRLMVEQMQKGGNSTGPVPDYGLTPRECEVLKLLTEGLVKKEIAQHIGMSYHTVDTHLRSIYRRLGVRSNTEAVARAVRESLV